MGGWGAFSDLEHEFSHSGSVHFKGVSSEFHTLELFSLVGWKLFHHISVLPEIAYLGIDFSNRTRYGDWFS